MTKLSIKYILIIFFAVIAFSYSEDQNCIDSTGVLNKWYRDTNNVSVQPIIHYEPKISIKPNPAKDILKIDFSSINTKIKSISIYSLDGSKVKDFLDENLSPKILIWDIKDNNGNNLPNGVYVIYLKSNDVEYSEKIIIEK